jgi:hypothetical protein
MEKKKAKVRKKATTEKTDKKEPVKTGINPKRQDELKQLARDIVNNLVFTDKHIPEEQRIKMIPSVFMPIVFLDEKQSKSILDMKVSMFYEYYDKATPRSINGYPIFASMRMLIEDEERFVWDFHEKYKKALDDVK